MSLCLQELVDRETDQKQADEKFNKTVSVAVDTFVAGILQHSPIMKKYYCKVSIECVEYLQDSYYTFIIGSFAHVEQRVYDRTEADVNIVLNVSFERMKLYYHH